MLSKILEGKLEKAFNGKTIIDLDKIVEEVLQSKQGQEAVKKEVLEGLKNFIEFPVDNNEEVFDKLEEIYKERIVAIASKMFKDGVFDEVIAEDLTKFIKEDMDIPDDVIDSIENFYIKFVNQKFGVSNNKSKK